MIDPDDAPELTDEQISDFAKVVQRDAQRYAWVRRHLGHVLVGVLSREGDSLLDLGPERVDFLVDAHRSTSDGKVKP